MRVILKVEGMTPYTIQATALVVLNALGYIGFKVVTTTGDSKVS